MSHRALIRFVAAASDEGIEDNDRNQQTVNNSLTGEEAKTFYEAIVNNDLCSQDPDIDEQNASNILHTSGNLSGEPHVSSSKARELNGVRTQQTDCDSNTLDYIDSSIKVENNSSFIDLESYSSEDNNYISQGAESSTCIIRDKTYMRKHNQLLGYAQNGDLEELKKLFSNDLDVDIDFQDQYGWTALMCAAVARQLDVVKLLLSKGANKFILNYKDKNVLELCEDVGAIDAKIVINTYHHQCKEEAKQLISKTDSFFCDICKANFSESTFKQHSTSTAHLFNLKLKPKTDQFMIPESNRGFQLMKKSGWDGEKGLGPEGQGHKYPVKTFLKRDRQCLGTGDKKKTKVTHFGPKDANAVKSIHQRSERIMSAKTISKRERKRKEQKARQWERNLRTYMNIDL